MPSASSHPSWRAEVGTEAKPRSGAGARRRRTWKDLTDNCELMASNLTLQVRQYRRLGDRIAGGDLSKKITVNVSGEILQLKETINTMVDQLTPLRAR